MKHVLVFVLAISAVACSSPDTSDAGDAASDAGPTDGRSDIVSADDAVDARADSGTDVTADAPANDTPAPDAGEDVATDTGELDVPLVDVAIDASGPAALCMVTGGTVDSARCCAATGDFPNSCVTGACGCSPSSSHNVMACVCPSGQCFDPALGCRTGP
jgi:hypothetical protein